VFSIDDVDDDDDDDDRLRRSINPTTNNAPHKHAPPAMTIIIHKGNESID
jgi:hypothetical protein